MKKTSHPSVIFAARANPGTGSTLNSSWVAFHAQATGSAHLARRLPCQDAVDAQAGSLPFVIACDGRGSAARSELGSAAGVNAFRTILQRRAKLIADILGTGRRHGTTRALRWRNLVKYDILPSLVTTLLVLAQEHGLRAADFEYTISAAVVGTRHIGWIQLGDSGLVAVNGTKAKLLCPPQQGNYAGETYFVSTDEYAGMKVAGGLSRLGPIKALFAFTDGVTPRFFNLQNGQPGPVFAQMALLLKSGKWSKHSVQELLQHDSWRTASDDDRSVAVLYRS